MFPSINKGVEVKLLARLVLALVVVCLVVGLGGGAPAAFAAPSTSSTCTVKLVRLGDKGTCAREAQEDLKRAGYNPGPIDGHFGPQSAAAARQAQIDHGIVPVSANYGELTRAVLKGGATPVASSNSAACKFKLVKSGDKGSCALEAQQDLKKAGYYNGPLDSHFGPQSAAATRQAQIDHGIQPVSANYGELTRAVLKGGATPRAPSDPKAQAPSSPNVATGVGVGFKTKTGMERKVQERLQFHKDPRGRPYYDGKLDGVFGEGSANGLIVFQYAWPGLRVTGTVDQATWDALMSNDQRHVSVGPGSIPQGSGIINSVSQRTSWLVINGQVVEQMDSRGPGLKPDKKTGIWRVHKMVWGKHTVYDKKIKTPSEYFGNEAMPHSLIYHPDSYVHGSALFDRDGYAGASFGCFNLHTWVAERIWPLVPKDKGWVYNKP